MFYTVSTFVLALLRPLELDPVHSKTLFTLTKSAARALSERKIIKTLISLSCKAVVCDTRYNIRCSQ